MDNEKAKPRSTFRRWLRRLALLVVILLLYRLTIWVALRTINEKELRSGLRVWGEQELCAGVGIHKLTVGINVLGKGKIVIHNLDIEHPNAAFEGYFVRADPISVTAPAWCMWGGECSPHISAKDLRVNIEWNDFGESSLAGLAEPLGDPQQSPAFPLGTINTTSIITEIRNGTLSIVKPGHTIVTDLAGRVHIDTRAGEIRGSSHPLALRYTCDKETASGEITVTSIDLNIRNAFEISACAATARLLPVKLISLIMPAMPKLSIKSTFSGSMSFDDNILSLAGTLKDAPLPLFGIEGEAPASGNLAVAKQDCSFTFGKSRKVTVTAGPDKPLLISSDFLNPVAFLQLPRATRLAWIDWGIINSREINLKARSASFAALQAEEIEILARSKGKRTIDVNMSATTSEGKLKLDITKWQYHSRKLPGTLSLKLNDANLATAGLIAPLLLPRLIAAKPRTGRVDLSLALTDSEKGIWHFLIAAKDIKIDSTGAGPLVSQLLNLPGSFSEVESLRLKALDREVTQRPPAAAFPSLQFTALEIKGEITSTPKGISGMITVSGKSPQLGSIVGGGRYHPDHSFKGTLNINDVPPSLLRIDKALSDEILKALTQLASEGLRIDFSTAATGDKIKLRFIQDAFRVWTGQQAKEKK